MTNMLKNWRRQWQQAGSGAVMLVVGLLLAGALGACSTPAGDISAGLPETATTSNGAFLIDTLTIRLSTVLQDSVNTSSPSYALVGRYRDSRLGAVSASSFFRVGYTDSYLPSSSEVFDSLTLELSTTAFRYGDTTQLQTVEVHRLRTLLDDNKTYYAFNELPYDATVLNQGTLATRAFRARPSLTVLRLRLADALGRELLTAAKLGTLTSDGQLQSVIAGLALVPGATDDAAILRFDLGTTASTLRLYTHEASIPDNVITQSFPLNYSSKHFYHVAADRTGTLLAPLTTRLQALDVSKTAQEGYLDGALGLRLKLEIPYLASLHDFGTHLSVTAATVNLETVNGAATRYLTPPTALYAYLSGRGNQQGLALGSSGGATVINYQSGLSLRTGIESGGYAFSLAAYCQAVLDRTIENTGLLLVSSVPESPERVVLGGPKHRESPLSFKLYFIR